MKKTLFLVSTLSILFVGAGYGNTWTGDAGNNDWFNNDNWNLGHYPTGLERVDIVTPGATVNVEGSSDSPASASASLLWMSGSTLTVKNATLDVTGTGDCVIIGASTDTASLIITEGGRFNFNASATVNMYIGIYTGQSGYVRVEKGGVLDVATGSGDEFGEIKVGNQGAGVLEIDGGYVYSSYGRIANQTDGSGTVTVDNGGEWIITNDLYLGNRTGNTASLTINDGKVHTGTYVSIGEKYNTRGDSISATVNGGELSGDTFLYVGRGADGTLTVTDGLVSFSDIQVAGTNGVSSMTVNRGSGTIYARGGEIESSGTFVVGYAGSSYGVTGMMKVENDAVITANTITVGQGTTGTLEIATDAGTLRRYDDKNTVSDIAGGSSNGTVKFTHGGSLDFDNVMSGSNLLVEHSGSGTTTLNGGNSYGRGTNLTKGVLIAAHENALGTGLVTISGGILETSVASGNVGGIAMSGGGLRLLTDGSQLSGLVGEMVVSGSFTMTGGTYELDILSLSSFDTVHGSGGGLALTGGVLDLSGYAGFEGTDTQGFEYQIFDGFAPATIGSIDITGYDKANWVAHLDETGLLYFVRNIPEPGTAALGFLGLFVWGVRRRK